MHSQAEPLPLLTRQEAEELIRPYAPKLRKCIEDAFECWKTFYAPQHHVLKPRTFASIMSDHILHNALTAFDDDDSVRWGKHGGIVAMRIQDKVDLRIKKFDRGDRTANIKTRQQDEYQRHMPFNGFDRPRLNAGYRTNGMRSDLTALLVTLQLGRNVRYRIDLAPGGQMVMEFVPADQIPPVRPKKYFRVARALQPPKQKQQ